MYEVLSGLANFLGIPIDNIKCDNRPIKKAVLTSANGDVILCEPNQVANGLDNPMWGVTSLVVEDGYICHVGQDRYFCYISYQYDDGAKLEVFKVTG